LLSVTEDRPVGRWGRTSSSNLLFLAFLGSLLHLILHFIEALCVGSTDEVGLHVINPTIWIHQVLIIFTLDLDNLHHDSIDHVDRLALDLFTLAILVTSLNLVHITLVIQVRVIQVVVIDCVRVTVQIVLRLAWLSVQNWTLSKVYVLLTKIIWIIIVFQT